MREPKTGIDPVDPLAVPDLDELVGKGKLPQDKTLEKYDLLEEIMRAMERINIPRGLDATKLSLVSGLVVPHKFKTLTFDKYNGIKCPTTHLTMYCRKMSAYTDNDKLLIYCFQDSFTGVAAQWYLKLDKVHIRSWKNLERAFLTQHKHAMDFTSDRLSFQTMEKKYNENFWDYAQRWRTMATQVQPPLIETEVTMLFLGTLQELYYDRLMPTETGSFANMVKAGNLIDNAIKNGRIDTRKAGSSQKGVIFQGKRKVRPRLCTSRTNPINLKGTLHTKIT